MIPFDDYHTGGGHKAWRLDREDGYVLITALDDCAAPSDPETDAMSIGIYDEACECITIVDVTGRQGLTELFRSRHEEDIDPKMPIGLLLAAVGTMLYKIHRNPD